MHWHVYYSTPLLKGLFETLGPTQGVQYLMNLYSSIDVVEKTRRAVMEAATDIKREAANMGIVINADKTKYQDINVGNQNVGAVGEFTYLGPMVNLGNLMSDEIKNQIMKANRAFGLLKYL